MNKKIGIGLIVLGVGAAIAIAAGQGAKRNSDVKSVRKLQWEWNGNNGVWKWNGTQNYFDRRSNGIYGGDNKNFTLFVGPKADGLIHFELRTKSGQFIQTLKTF